MPRSTRLPPSLVLVLVTAAAVLAPRPATAADPAAAESLFDQGRQLMDQGRYSEACPKFEESQRLDPGLGTQFHLADCWEHLGRTATAWALFREVESQARAQGEGSREKIAHDRAATLQPMLPRLVIDPDGAASTPGLAV